MIQRSDGRRVEVKSGYILLDQSSAEGGVHYEREVIDEIKDGDEVTKVWKTIKHVDHDTLVRACSALSKKVDYLLRKHCTRFGAGRSSHWFADEDQYRAVMADIEPLHEKADQLNESCRTAGCARRVYISVVPAKLDLATPDAAREVSRTIQRRLGALRDCLRRGDLTKFENKYLLPCRNLDKMAVGICAESIVFAIDEAKSARREIAEKVKRGQTPESAGKQANLGSIEAAITMFAPMDEQLPDDEDSSSSTDDDQSEADVA